jgi:hypothetical protein
LCRVAPGGAATTPPRRSLTPKLRVLVRNPGPKPIFENNLDFRALSPLPLVIKGLSNRQAFAGLDLIVRETFVPRCGAANFDCSIGSYKLRRDPADARIFRPARFLGIRRCMQPSSPPGLLCPTGTRGLFIDRPVYFFTLSGNSMAGGPRCE